MNKWFLYSQSNNAASAGFSSTITGQDITLTLDKMFPTFRRTLVPSSSELSGPRTLATWHYCVLKRKELAIQRHGAKHARSDSSAPPLRRYQVTYGTWRSMWNVKLRSMHSEKTVSCWLHDMGWKTFHKSSLQCCLKTVEPQREIILGIKCVFLVPPQTLCIVCSESRAGDMHRNPCWASCKVPTVNVWV
jgi:hypothetical protein